MLNNKENSNKWGKQSWCYNSGGCFSKCPEVKIH